MKANQLTQAQLMEEVHYDPESGIFTNKRDRSKKSPKGSQFGTVRNDGYVQAAIKRRAYGVHVLAWLYQTGAWPTHCIDHINGIRDDNRFANLREATKSQNGQNQRRAHSQSRTGLIGVSPWRGGYRAGLTVGGKVVLQKWFASAEDASRAYTEAKIAHHPYQTISESAS